LDDLVEQYQIRYRGRGPLTRDQIRTKFDAGYHLNPEGSWKLTQGREVYASAPDVLARNEIPAALRPEFDAAQQQSARARTQRQQLELEHAPDALIEVARTAEKKTSWMLGEVGADVYVQARYPGPPPPERLWPVGESAGTSRSGDFDRVYKVSDQYGRTRIVFEAKGNTAQLGDRIVGVVGGAQGTAVERADQGTKRYLDSVTESMSYSANAEMRRVGLELERAIRRGDVDYVEVRTTASPPAIEGRAFDLNIDTGTHP
jgi:hypothetical protein